MPEGFYLENKKASTGLALGIATQVSYIAPTCEGIRAWGSMPQSPQKHKQMGHSS